MTNQCNKIPYCASSVNGAMVKTLFNRGIRSSPWEPSRYLWAALEGLTGVSIEDGQPQIEPHAQGQRAAHLHKRASPSENERLPVAKTYKKRSGCGTSKLRWSLLPRRADARIDWQKL